MAGKLVNGWQKDTSEVEVSSTLSNFSIKFFCTQNRMKDEEFIIRNQNVTQQIIHIQGCLKKSARNVSESKLIVRKSYLYSCMCSFLNYDLFLIERVYISCNYVNSSILLKVPGSKVWSRSLDAALCMLASPTAFHCSKSTIEKWKIGASFGLDPFLSTARSW